MSTTTTTPTLSSNWKKLQATLVSSKKDGGRGKDNSKDSGSQTTLLKRKRQTPGTPGSSTRLDSTGSKKRQKISENRSGRGSDHIKAGKKMGAYVSSLPGLSYRGQHKNALAPSTSTLQDKSELAQEPHIKDEVPATERNSKTAGKYISLDCEMVGTYSMTPFSILANHNRHQQSSATAPPEYSILGRVSLVSYALETIYDAYVLPPSGIRICDYRTQYSGITAWHLDPTNKTTNPKTFEVVQREVADILSGRVLVGHALKHDLEILGLSHPRRDIRDTARYPPFRARAAVMGKDGKPGKAKTPSLKKLSAEVLGWMIQADEKKGHSSAEDAKAAMALFKVEKAGFEREVIKTFGQGALRRQPLDAKKSDHNRPVAFTGKGPETRLVVPEQTLPHNHSDDDMSDMDEEQDDNDGEPGQEQAPMQNINKKRKDKRKKHRKGA